MLTIRSAQWPQDIPLLAGLDTEFTTDRIYRPIQDGFSFRLEEEAVPPFVKKVCDFDPADVGEREAWSFAAIAEQDGKLAGFAAAEHEAWNNRVNIRHIYVTPAFRRKSVGSRLLCEIDAFARSIQARSLWLETQNINHPAIQFYLRSGFQFCGFDTGLYDPKSVQNGEIALFFERPIAASPANNE